MPRTYNIVAFPANGGTMKNSLAVYISDADCQPFISEECLPQVSLGHCLPNSNLFYYPVHLTKTTLSDRNIIFHRNQNCSVSCALTIEKVFQQVNVVAPKCLLFSS